MPLDIVSLDQRPDLVDALWSFSDGWPEFMLHDPVSYLLGLLPERFPHLQLLALDGDEVVAKAHAIGFVWTGDDPSQLWDRGWDEVLERGMLDHERGHVPSAVSALEISVRPHLRGTGLSAQMVAALRDATAAVGLRDLFAPVRPNHKHLEPHTPMSAYAHRVRGDGLPHDPWLRVHVRAGARVIKVAPLSMTIPGTLDDWRGWTGLPFDASGEVVVEGALNPVLVNVDHDQAVYVEPNVWMHHQV